MWRDIKMWLAIRYLRWRIYESNPETSSRGQDKFIEENDGRVFAHKEAFTSELSQLGKRLFLMFFPLSWRIIKPRQVFGSQETVGNNPIHSLVKRAEENNFFEFPVTIITNAGDASVFVHGVVAKEHTDKNYIRTSPEGDEFATPTGGLLYFSKKYKEVLFLIWVIIIWLINKIFGLFDTFCSIFINNRMPFC